MKQNITSTELRLFEALRVERLKASDVFKTRGFRGMWSGVIDKYPEKAHFVYELLQNADDVKATEVYIELTKTGLIFKHNGSIHFSVSEEKEDVEPYGHINAITGVGNSTKSDDVNKIGKFGVGFKAVFRYSDEPYIYDDKFWFKIVNYVIPELLTEDHPKREKGETLFYFPFNNASKAYKEIKARLGKLDNPILFLKNLKKVTWSENGKVLSYTKTITPISKKGNIKCSKVEIDNCGTKKKLIMFTKPLKIKGNGQHDIHLGYYLTENGDIDTSVRPRVFCFFPTSEKINLCFVCHAPFLLTDSRQQLKADEDLNITLIKELAELQAQSLLFLKEMKNGRKRMLNENIFDIVSLDGDNYNDDEDDEDDDVDSIVTQEEFYKACKTVILENELLLSSNNTYTKPKDAYTCNPVDMMSFMKDNQLQLLSNNNNAQFLLRSISSRNNGILSIYLRHLGVNAFNPRELASNLTENFMAVQSHEWVSSFYKFLNDDQFSLCNPDNLSAYSWVAKPVFLGKPIVMTTQNEWVNPYTDDNELNVYFPLETDTDDYNIVNTEYVEDKNCRAFLTRIGIKEPSQKDHISHALEKYTGDESITKHDVENDFENLFSYYHSLNTKNDKKAYLEDIKSKVRLVNVKDNTLSVPDNLFDDSVEGLQELIKYDQTLDTVDFDFYEMSIEKHGKEEVCDFMYLLGVHRTPKLVKTKKWGYYALTKSQKERIDRPHNTGERVEDIDIQGLTSLWANSDNGKTLSKEVSIYLWNYLASLDIDEWTVCSYEYKYYSWYTIETHSMLYERLRDTEWLLGKKPCEVKQEELTSNGFVYDEDLFKLFGIEKEGKTLKEMGASESQIRREEIGAFAESNGITMEDLIKLAEMKKLNDTSLNSNDNSEEEADNDQYEYNDNSESRSTSHHSSTSETKQNSRHEHKSSYSTPGNTEENYDEEYQNYDDDVEDDNIFNRDTLREASLNDMFSASNAPSSRNVQDNDNEENDSDDEVDDVMQKLIEQEEKHNQTKELRKQVSEATKYSKEWFETLLELEYKGNNEDKSIANSKSLSISFGKVSKESGSERIYILNNPSRSIPLWIEEIGDIEVKCKFSNRDELTLRFEVANVRDNSLRLKASKAYEEILNKIEWHCCTMASITLKNQIDLMGKLRTAFNSLNLPAGYNLKDHLTSRIKFIFGPPGTGKTTNLANKILDKMSNKRGYKILVLAPTNTACDEIARKIIEKNPDDYSWLCRFVSSADENLDDIVVDRESMIYDEDRCCVISTIARLSFDGFNGHGGYNKLMDIDWDMVICDEASMISLADIVFAIYNFKATPILIAGDPMQIMPIVQEEQWKGENIYTMVKLDRFDKPKTEPIQFEIENLSMQYRSLPSIGELFSRYAYNGQLRHYRSAITAKKRNFGNLKLKQINFIPFKVERYDSVFGVKKLDGSNVHIYSVLLSLELFKYIAKEYAMEQSEKFSIGIVCPYAPQAQLIESLISQTPNIPECVSVEVGTVHRFQGGQCDMIITVLNPPMGLKTASERVFLNNKNIINVSISRAKDYLCILLPHCDTDGYENLYEINALGNIAKKDPENVANYTCDQIEEIIFGRKFYIESNTFVTSHQLANVYSKAVKRYEIRIDEKSVDIQLGNVSSSRPLNLTREDVSRSNLLDDISGPNTASTNESPSEDIPDNSGSQNEDLVELAAYDTPDEYYARFSEGNMTIEYVLDTLFATDTYCSAFILSKLFCSTDLTSKYNWHSLSELDIKIRRKLIKRDGIIEFIYPQLFLLHRFHRIQIKDFSNEPFVNIEYLTFKEAFNKHIDKIKEKKSRPKPQKPVKQNRIVSYPYHSYQHQSSQDSNKLYTHFEYGLSDW